MKIFNFHLKGFLKTIKETSGAISAEYMVLITGLLLAATMLIALLTGKMNALSLLF